MPPTGTQEMNDTLALRLDKGDTLQAILTKFFSAKCRPTEWQATRKDYYEIMKLKTGTMEMDYVATPLVFGIPVKFIEDN
jgi:hypothetical protein